MTDYRADLPTIPQRMRHLPVDERGYPIPWFVAYHEGKPEFRAMDGAKLRSAIQESRCWVCGDILGKYVAFVIGPMCAINRVSGEPPCHRECAEFSAKACPFLINREKRRRTDNLPEKIITGEQQIDRQPGVAMIWITTGYRLVQARPLKIGKNCLIGGLY